MKLREKKDLYKVIFDYDTLVQLVNYEAETGTFFRPKNNRKIIFNQTNEPESYLISIQYNNVRYRIPAHNIAWMLYYKRWNYGIIFHRDFNESNFKISNLKEIPKVSYNDLLRIYRSLTKVCKIVPHKTDQYKFIVHYSEAYKSRSKTFCDYIQAEIFLNRKKRNLAHKLIGLGVDPSILTQYLS